MADMRSSIGGRLVCGTSKGGHHLLCEKLLRLDALPMVESAEVGDNGQLADAAFRLKILDLPDDFFRCSDETDFLVHDFVVGEFSQGL